MVFADLSDSLGTARAHLRGHLTANAPIADYTWFRVGGPAQLLFQPADEEDLQIFLAALPSEVPVTVLGLASNSLVRDGGIPGAVIRLSARGFGGVSVEHGVIRAGAAAPDVKVARAAADASLGGLTFFRGIPGSVGGALRMNAGAYGGETRDAFIGARAVDRQGRLVVLDAADMGFAYRHSAAAADLIFTEATFRAMPGDQIEILAAMEKITESREATQPVKSRTGGSTFKNPPDGKAWQLIDAAGCRGLTIGGAQVSELHCNFLINVGGATATELELLGETVRNRVLTQSGIRLDWEIKRFGIWPEGIEVAAFLGA